MAATANYTYPGVYLNETAVAAHVVTPATTNLTAVLGIFPRGPVGEAVLVTSWQDFSSQFGRIDPSQPPFGASATMAPYAVWQFFQNGGIGAWIVRVAPPDAGSAQATIGPLTLTAASPGTWATDYNGLNAELRPSAGSSPLPPATQGGASPGPDHVDLILSAPAPTNAPALSPVVEEVIPSLTPSTAVATISAVSNYVAASGTPTVPASPSSISQPLTGGSSSGGASATVSGLQLTSKLVGKWASAAQLTATVQASAQSTTAAPLFDLILTVPGQVVREVVANLPTANATTLAALVNEGSALVTAKAATAPIPPASPQIVPFAPGTPGTLSETNFVTGVLAALGEAPTVPAPQSPLDQIAPQVFNIMCIPDLAWFADVQAEVVTAAHKFCEERQAFLLVDPLPPPNLDIPPALGGGTPKTTLATVGTLPSELTLLEDWAAPLLGPNNVAGATYYPWVQIADPFNDFKPRFVPPSGTIAGVYATTDLNRGVFKAPAGTAATLEGVTGLADTTINDGIDGDLNVLGINCLRTFPIFGHVSWGARTLAGADLIGSPYKYVPVRRMADFIEQSLTQSLRWAVFEPNGEALWSQIAIEVGQFMSDQFARGAFAGTTAAQAYTVACDASTTSAEDQLRGVVNVNVTFAPIEPAEFVVLNITLNAGPPAAS